MPKQTFFRLPEVKRTIVVNAAIDEFSENDFEKASIAKIVANSNIARGSFYQYFESKEDLYSYLLDLVFCERLQLENKENEASKSEDYGAVLEHLIEQGLKYESSNPKFSKLFIRAMFGNDSVKEISAKRIKEVTFSKTRHIIADGIASGYFRPEIDIDLAAYVLTLLISHSINYLHDYIPKETEGDNVGYLRRNINDDQIMDVFYKLTDILNYGLKNTPKDPLK